jgi:hypothetical protein
MKKIIRANVSSAGVLDKSIAMTSSNNFCASDSRQFAYIFRERLVVPQQGHEIKRRLQENRHLRGEKQSKKINLLYPGQ